LNWGDLTEIWGDKPPQLPPPLVALMLEINNRGTNLAATYFSFVNYLLEFDGKMQQTKQWFTLNGF